MRQMRVMLVLSIITSSSLQVFSLANAVSFRIESSDEIVDFRPDRLIQKCNLCQNTGRWEEVRDSKFSLKLLSWQLVTSPGSSDKYMDKRVIGTVKNNSKTEFSEVKVEFTVYDGDGNQIAIVLSNHYDFKPGDIWKFQIPVTEDVEKAELRGLYVYSNE